MKQGQPHSSSAGGNSENNTLKICQLKFFLDKIHRNTKNIYVFEFFKTFKIQKYNCQVNYYGINHNN